MGRFRQRQVPRAIWALAVLGIAACAAAPAAGGEVLLRNGMRFSGRPVFIPGVNTLQNRQPQGDSVSRPVVMVHTGMQRIFVPRIQVAEADQSAELSRYEVFRMPPHRRTGRSQMIQTLGALREVTEFDEFGRRRVTITTAQGPVHVIQGVTTIDPRHLTVEALSHVWEFGVATSSLPEEQLDRMLRTATDPLNPDDRMAIARFYLQAGMYLRAGAELDAIVVEFPELKSRVEEVAIELRTLQARELLAEIRRRRDAGQHHLAFASIHKFPTQNMSASVLREVRELDEEYRGILSDGEQALALLGDLQAELGEPERARELEPLRSEVREQLNAESLPRLEAFLRLESDETLSPAEKLALAYSGWVLGSAHAVTDLDLALRLWQARFLALEYLRSDDPASRTDHLARLHDLEGVGPEQLGWMAPLLPPVIETPDAEPGRPVAIETDAPGDDAPVRYSVLLPPEYTPHHVYPAIVALHAADMTTDQQLAWWGGAADSPGQAQRHGYIVIAPEYPDGLRNEYNYSTAVHRTVLESIRDARRRFNLDSDRLFLSGHGMGADAAFDIGMSHPDVFAGVIAINGVSDYYCKWYLDNTKHLPFYVVAGELAPASLNHAVHAGNMHRMMRTGRDIIYAEYIGRGYESYYSEIHRLFEWMGLCRRVKHPPELEVKTLRPGDNRFYWLEVHGLPQSVLQSQVMTGDGGVRPMTITAKISDGSEGHTTIHVRSGADRNVLWLSPDLVSFDKRLSVNAKGRRRAYDLVPRMDVLLEDLRRRGDRQHLFWAKLEID